MAQIPANNAPDLDRIRAGDCRELADAIDRLWQRNAQQQRLLDALLQNSALTPIYCRLYRQGSAQNILDATLTECAWDTPPSPGDFLQGVDVGGLFDPLVSTSRVTLREPGLYAIEAMVKWDATVAGTRQAAIKLVGATDNLTSTLAEVSAAGTLRQYLSTIVPWKAIGGTGWTGDIAIEVLQNSGGTRTVSSAGVKRDHWLSVTRIGAVR